MTNQAPGLDRVDSQCRMSSQQAMGREIELLDNTLLHINHGLAPLSGKKHDRGLNFLATILLTTAFNALWRAREDAVCGYPMQCLTSCRRALEDWATLLYCERDQDRVKVWLTGVLKEYQHQGWPPRFKEIWADLGDLGERMEEIYGVLSLFAHPRGPGLVWAMHWDPETTYLHAGGHFDTEQLRRCLYFLFGTTQALLERVAQLQFRVLGAVDQVWVGRGREFSRDIAHFIDSFHDEVIASAPTDEEVNG